MPALTARLQKYVDLVAGFSGREWAGEDIAGAAIKSRTLLVAIDKGAMTAEQWNQMTGAITYGLEKGVAVKFVSVQ